MRSVRVNELIKREVSDILHTNYREQAVYITVTEVSTTPDLRQAHIYYSVLGGGNNALDAQHFFTARHKDIRQHLSKRIILKYLPRLHFHEDDSVERGMRVIELLDELDDGSDVDAKG